MILVWGTKERRKAAGHVADVCPSCAAITAHRLTELREVPHVYYLPIGPGKVAGYQVECGPCAAVQGVDPARYTARLDAEIELVAAELERLTDLDRLESRGTLRLVLREALFESRSVDVAQMTMIVERILPQALAARGVDGSASICERLAIALKSSDLSTSAAQSPDAIFDRLIRR